MNNAVRALLRVVLTAIALVAMTHLPFLGIAFHGTILGAFGLALAFEACIWLGLLVYAMAATFLGFTPEELPLAVNSVFLWLIGTGFIAFLGYQAPALISVGGILAAMAGGLVLLVISMVTMWRTGESCPCRSRNDEDESN